MISGIGATVDAATLSEKGIAKVLSKPHSFAQLEAALRSILGTPASVSARRAHHAPFSDQS